MVSAGLSSVSESSSFCLCKGKGWSRLRRGKGWSLAYAGGQRLEPSLTQGGKGWSFAYVGGQRLEPSLTLGGKGWSLRLRRGQRLEPSLTSGGQGWSLRLRGRLEPDGGAKAGAFAYLDTRRHGIDNSAVRNAQCEVNHCGGVLERFFVCPNLYNSVIGLDFKTSRPKLRLVRDF